MFVVNQLWPVVCERCETGHFQHLSFGVIFFLVQHLPLFLFTDTAHLKTESPAVTVCANNTYIWWSPHEGCIKGVMNGLLLICTALWVSIIIFSRSKNHSEVTNFCPVFNPLTRRLCLNRLGGLRSKQPLLWLANSCVCLTAYILHRWMLQWFTLF